MSEWIKFTLSTADSFRTWFDVRLDGEVHYHTGDDGVAVDQHISRYVGGDKPERVFWFGIDEPHVSESANHVLQFTVLEWEGDQSPAIKLDSIMLGDLVHTKNTIALSNDVTTLNAITPEFQVMIDSGKGADEGGVAAGQVVTEDIGNGSQSYYTTNWDGDQIFGMGCWKLTYTCPYMDWFDAIHDD